MPPPNDPEFAEVTMGLFRQGVSALEKALAEIDREWQAAYKGIEDLLRRVQRFLNNDSPWSTVKEFVTDKIKEAVEQIQRLVNEIGTKVSQILNAIREAVHKSIPVGSLFEVGFAWADDVNPRLSPLGSAMTGSGKIDHWRGPAKLTYEKRVQDQIDAVDSTVDRVKATSVWLATVAKANTAYMVQLGDRVADMAGQLTTVLIEATQTAAGVVTQFIPTLQDFAGMIGSAVTHVMQYQMGLANRLAEVVEQIVNIAAEVGDLRGLDKGKWPQAVNSEG